MNNAGEHDLHAETLCLDMLATSGKVGLAEDHTRT
jgi:hypothetical protein